MGLLTLKPGAALAPWRAPWNLEEEFNRFFEDFSKGLRSVEERFTAAIDVRETDDAYIVEADVPGIKKEDVHIEVNDDVLTIKGERKGEHEEKRKDYHRIERQSGSFRRCIRIPGGFKSDAVDAKFEDGVLRVTLPKLEDAKPRRIEVKTS